MATGKVKRIPSMEVLTGAPVATDLDSCTSAGTYEYNTSTQNTPSDFGYCVVFASENPDDASRGRVYQLAFGTTGGVFTRRKTNNGSFQGWKAFTLTNL